MVVRSLCLVAFVFVSARAFFSRRLFFARLSFIFCLHHLCGGGGVCLVCGGFVVCWSLFVVDGWASIGLFFFVGGMAGFVFVCGWLVGVFFSVDVFVRVACLGGFFYVGGGWQVGRAPVCGLVHSVA
ncbi:hypothetical protein [Pseudomonas syringae]|uniref:hypothetical protein n=1 Tax=Pseudomonas syringae TaxID=317 RepID=UPI0011416351|nr:hypothetical protein [Pseudomonas syringae]